MNKGIFITTSIITFVISFFGVWFVYYYLSLKPVSNNSEVVNFSVQEGNNFYSIADELKNEKLIRSKFVYKLYVRLNQPSNIKAGVYQLNKNMSIMEIIATLSGNIVHDLNSVSITFKEGNNMRYIIKQIVDNTENTENDVINTLTNQQYLKGLIKNYWFISDDILNSNIYYSLEGYLYPNTYSVKRNSKVEDIFDLMIDQMDQKLSKYKNDIKKSPFTPSEILTLASIIELEGIDSSDRAGISGVFYNRLNNNWSLGSDVTAYYGVRVNLHERDLTTAELNDDNPYNTRISSMMGKLPIGPICNPSEESIKAAIYPEQHNYYYFVSDKNGKTYFTKTAQEHSEKKNELIKAGLWYTYE